MGYENDLANLGVLSGGAQGFIKGIQDAEDHSMRLEDQKMRRMEMDAKTRILDRERETQAEERARKARNDALDARAKGLMAPAGSDIMTADPNTLQWDPAYIQMQQQKAQAMAGADPFGVKAMAGQKARAEAPFNNLPKDQQIQVEASAKHIENVNYIKKSLEATLSQLDDPKLSDDLKLMAARESIKTLNSTQGQDAVGAEEAKRLASLLEYKILPRLGEPGKAFGRDIPMFTEQMRNNVARLGQTAESLQSEIDSRMGRPPPRGKLKSGLVTEPRKGLISAPAAQKPLEEMSDAELDALHKQVTGGRK